MLKKIEESGSLAGRIFSLKLCALSACALVAGALLCSCQTEVNYEPLFNAGAKAFAPTNPDSVEIFITKRPTYPYAEMGVLSFETFSDSSASDIYDRFRVAAAKIGATGVIMLPNQTVINSVPHVSYDYYGNPIILDTPTSDTMYKGVAIRKVDSASDINNLPPASKQMK